MQSAPARDKAQSPAIEGRIDQIAHGIVNGWAVCRDEPTRRIAVEVFVDGVLVGTGIADRQREDLVALGAGDGQHGFHIDLPKEICDGQAHEVRIIDAETRLPFEAGEGSFVLHQATLRGRLDEVEDGAATGWAFNPGRPDERVQVRVLVDGRAVAEVRADGLRPDLQLAGFGDGRHGFIASLPSYLVDEDPHTVQIVEAGTGVPIDTTSEPIRLRENHKRSSFALHDLYTLFDEAFYGEQSGEVSGGLQHYMEQGWKLGYNPHPLFDTEYYLALHGDLLAGVDPLTHFFEVGRWSHYDTHPLFEAKTYARLRPDAVRGDGHGLFHYLKHGWKEGMRPSPFFDEANYLSQTPGVREAGFVPLLHYLRFGWREGRRPHPDFDPTLFGRLARLPKHRDPFSAFLTRVLTERQPEVERKPPRLSIIILNLSKTLVTLQCLYFLRAYTDLTDAEIIILDNGSPADRFTMLCEHAADARIIRLHGNRGFGEGNNIAVDAARGELLLFLNNDAFVSENWLPPLIAALDADPEVGAAGPKFVYPDGRLQEAGCVVAADGSVLQRGKFMDANFGLFDGTGPTTVDYCSAATLLIRAKSFRQAFGFDLCWDPAYYEDADLCLKLRLLGQRTVYVPNSLIVHVENGTSSDQALDLRLHDVVAINRLKFVSRWSQFLAGQSNGDAERRLMRKPVARYRPRGLPHLGLYTPYPLTPGGGERYLLTVASVLRGRFECTLLTPDQFSRARLDTMARELDLELNHLSMARIDEAAAKAPFDIFISMGNEVLPPVRGFGALNLFHCQFPFPLDREHYAGNWDKLENYAGYVVNSEFTRYHVERARDRLGLPRREVHVLPPPVPQVGPGEERASEGAPLVILHVGRFSPGGHCKRQDVMIEAFRELAARAKRPLELHLAGALNSESSARTYLAGLQQAARGLPVYFHINVMPEQIHALYRRASIYWHLTGIGSDVHASPEVFEHFGITICEAMSAGVVPVVLGHGGPAETISNGRDGFLVATRDELLTCTEALIAGDRTELTRIGEHARNRAASFAIPRFAERLLEIIALAGGPRSETIVASLPARRSDRIEEASLDGRGLSPVAARPL